MSTINISNSTQTNTHDSIHIPQNIQSLQVAAIAQNYMTDFARSSETVLSRFSTPLLQLTYVPTLELEIAEENPSLPLTWNERSIGYSKLVWEVLTSSAPNDLHENLEAILQSELAPCCNEDSDSTIGEFGEDFYESHPVYQYQLESDDEMLEDAQEEEFSTFRQVYNAAQNQSFHPEALELLEQIMDEIDLCNDPSYDFPMPDLLKKEVTEEDLENLQFVLDRFLEARAIVNKYNQD